jgi:hypothetical protein
MAMAPRVFMIQPRYGDVSDGAARAFYRPHTRHNIPAELCLEIAGEARPSASATPRCFNIGLMQALVARDNGLASHVAMIHSDIDPDGPWLNVLWGEMRRLKVDLVAAVTAIKNDEGRTSTAIGDRDDPWKVNRFVAKADYGYLPDTFQPGDVCDEGEVLLVNTGLWLADLRAPWWDTFPGFQWFNRMYKVGNVWHEDFRPEDWELSRHIDREGGTYAATWMVPIRHWGSKAYHNQEA